MKQLLLSLLVLLLLSPLTFSEVCLTDEEAMMLDQKFIMLEKLLEEQRMEYEFLQTLFSAQLKEISGLETSLKKAELSLDELEKENNKKTVIWAVGSLLTGGAVGLIAGIIIE